MSKLSLVLLLALSRPGILEELDDARTGLVTKVSPSVVQVLVTGLSPVGERNRPTTGLFARQQGLGSGVIVDPSGYILTNEHVIHGSQRVVVVLPAGPGVPSREDDGKRRTFEAQVVGSVREVDLALLKIDAANLPALKLQPEKPVRQGEMVFAIGSPEGLASTVTMGVVSSASREVVTNIAMTFIQTDAPINPGNSGGALIDAAGDLIGINTFILSDTGGSQGLGFAIPAAMAKFVYESLRKYGHVYRLEAGMGVQSISPVLAKGLHLPRDWGVVVSDTALEGPARRAGLQAGDIIDSTDGRPIDSVASLTSAIYLHPEGKPLHVVVLRGEQKVIIDIRVGISRQPTRELADLAQGEKNLVRRLGILALTVDDSLQGLVHLREGSGVVVAARTLDATRAESGLEPGDVIHSLNQTPIKTVEQLQEAVRTAKRGESVVLQVERQGAFTYLPFEMD
ncbi:MAG TPA: trypsin-like peptidase domain-containing protein [Myxococcales bacterium]|nr:trypsin-like peptidase domain-containing protein [Myxococcales bacterium]